jgi:acyl-CoA synthetase (AMP-forming)/AMP-acid ligase II
VGFIDGDWRATFAQHADRVLRLAHAMRHQLGMEPDDRFAVMAANGHEFLELYHVGFLGAGVINPLNLRLAGAELQHIVRDSGTKVVFVDSFFADHFDRNVAEVREELGLEHVVLIGDADAPHSARYEDLLAAGEPAMLPEPAEEDPVVLMYTGGTTGLPKGVLLDQRAEMLNIMHVGLLVGLSPDRVYLHQTPMFHAAGITGVLGIPGTGGTSVSIPMFEPAQVLDAIEAHDVDITVMVPTMIAMLLEHEAYRPERLASVQNLVYGASPMPPALQARIQAELPWVALGQAYGMTEASAVLTYLSPEDHEAGGPVLRSAGHPVPGVRLAIHDMDGNELPRREEGEVVARAGNIMRAYWNNPEATAEAFRGGWYHTGDAGYLDERGYLFLVDRVKDMIVTGGENVYSIEVENALSGHPAVEQVAVIGIPHDTWGEQVHAIVVLRDGQSVTEDELKAYARRQIAGYKVPKSIEFRTEPLPLSGALKPLKRELRKPYWEGRGRAVN